MAAEWPEERLLHLVARGGRCAHVGRAHHSNNVMLTVDLMNGLAFQRCWGRAPEGADVCGRGARSVGPLLPCGAGEL